MSARPSRHRSHKSSEAYTNATPAERALHPPKAAHAHAQDHADTPADPPSPTIQFPGLDLGAADDPDQEADKGLLHTLPNGVQTLQVIDPQGPMDPPPAWERVPWTTREERRVEALNLRMAGNDYRVIAKSLGVSVKTAYFDVQDAIIYLATHERVLAENVRAMELARLDAMQAALWTEAMRGNPFAVASQLRIMERRSKYLGLDVPEMVQDNLRRPLRTVTNQELLQLAEQLRGLPAPAHMPNGTAGGDVASMPSAPHDPSQTPVDLSAVARTEDNPDDAGVPEGGDVVGEYGPDDPDVVWDVPPRPAVAPVDPASRPWDAPEPDPEPAL